MPSRPRVASGPRPRSTRLLAVLAAFALSATLAACGGGDKDSADKKPDSQPVAGGVKLAALWPLTGEPVTGSTPRRPVLVTKIDNSSDSRPQVGLNKADLITEELVEGGITRLAVFYYQRLPDIAGPVRSMRASDIGIVKPAHATIVASGAAPPTLGRLRANRIRFYDGGGPGYFRDSSRIAPHNLMVHMGQLADSLKKKKAVVPASYLPWGKDSDFTGTVKAGHIDAIFSRSSTTSWAYQGGKYVNTNSNAAQGERFNPSTVLVLRVHEGDAGYLDPAGNKVPETLYFGKGPALLFHNGQVVRGTWTKKSRKHPVSLSTAAGRLKVPAGHVWIELVPVDKDGGKVAFRR
jgi:hypothetical protein